MAMMTDANVLLRVLQQAEESGDASREGRGGFIEFTSNSWAAFMGIVLGGLMVITLSICVLQVICRERWGIRICPGAGLTASMRRRSRMRALEEQEELARQIQRQLNEEVREEERQQALQKKRTERRTKYEALLASNTMVVKEGDLCYSIEDSLQSSAAGSHIDVEKGFALNTSHHTLDEEHLLLTLPIKDKAGQPRCVAGQCTVCIGDYEAGETVVWSTNPKCQHAFHSECILMWLSKGKKRCPVCRHFFCPTTTVEIIKDVNLDESEMDEESEHSSRDLEDGVSEGGQNSEDGVSEGGQNSVTSSEGDTSSDDGATSALETSDEGVPSRDVESQQ